MCRGFGQTARPSAASEGRRSAVNDLVTDLDTLPRIQHTECIVRRSEALSRARLWPAMMRKGLDHDYKKNLY